MKQNKGITLVALVITVIVLLILTGITLKMTIGDNGIISKAQESKNESLNDTIETESQINELYGYIDSDTVGSSVKGTNTNLIQTVASAKGTVISQTENIQLKDDENNIITLPAGFRIANESPTKQEEGIVVEDKECNQFVWIPVANISDYARIDFGSDFANGGYSSYSETIPTDEKISVSTYHGYYIGRYEAGDSVSTANKTMRTDGASVTNKIAIQKGQAPYDFVTRDQSITLAEGMKAAEKYIATTKLCSSYAWDTAINFIQKTVSNYGISSNQGNYQDTTFTYTDITGASQTKASGSNILTPTGQSAPVCNIYDIGGNDWEWTTETFNADSTYPCTYRGGSFGYKYSIAPSGYRNYGTTVGSNDGVTFRPALYM